MDISKLRQNYTYKDGNLFYNGVQKLCRKDKDGYLSCKVGRRTVSLARAIYSFHHGEIQKGMYIDHIDGDTFNNKIENLRMVTPSQNAENRRIHREGKLPGISRQQGTTKWKSGITLTINIHLGTEEQPELARDNYLFAHKLIAEGIKDYTVILAKLAEYKSQRDPNSIPKLDIDLSIYK